MKLFHRIACILVVFLLGCTNDEFSDPMVDTPDIIQDCFFTNECLSLRISDNSRSSNHVVIDRTIEYFNNNHHEKNKLENKYGYPVWDAFYEELSSEIKDGLIPIINEDSELVEAVLYIKIDPVDDQLYFRTIDRKDIHKLLKKTDKEQKPKKDQDISRELAVGMFLHFDSFLFGHTDCELIAYAPSGARRDQVSTRDEIVTCYYEYGYIVECYYYEIGGQIYSTDCSYTPYSETIFCFTSPGGTIGLPDNDPDPTNTTSDGSNQPGADPCEDAECAFEAIGNMCRSSIIIENYAGQKYSRVYGLSIDFIHPSLGTVPVTMTDICFSASDLATNQVKWYIEEAVRLTEFELSVLYPNSTPSSQTIKEMFKTSLSVVSQVDYELNSFPTVHITFGWSSCEGIQGKRGIWGDGNC